MVMHMALYQRERGVHKQKRKEEEIGLTSIGDSVDASTQGTECYILKIEEILAISNRISNIVTKRNKTEQENRNWKKENNMNISWRQQAILKKEKAVKAE